jgi:pyrroline-5-carboxylate reductase
MLTQKTLGFIGAGNLAEAIIKGLLASKAAVASRIVVSDKISERLVLMAETYEVKVCNKNFEVAKNADIIFITVKPNDVQGTLSEIASELTKDKLLISAAAGITTGFIEDTLRASGLKSLYVPVIRAMPNTPVIVREGATALFAGEGAKASGMKFAKAVFSAVGKVIIVEDEALMDAVTGLSGSGPAYVFLIMQAMAQAGVQIGLTEDDAKLLAIQTTLGSARLALDGNKPLTELIRMVASPGGTTIEGLKKLEECGTAKAIISAVTAAVKRADELKRAR